MNRTEHWKRFIEGYDLEKFKRITHEDMLDFLQRQDIEESYSWLTPPSGIKYTELKIKFYGIFIRVSGPGIPVFRVRYNLYLHKDDLMPYYYYDADFDFDEVLIDDYFSTHIIEAH